MPDNPHFFMTRGLMFGHTDIKPVFEAMKKKKKFAVMTGIKPSGYYHIGSLATAQELVYFQQQGGKVFYCIADLEALATNNQSLEESRLNAIDNVADLLALGLDPDPEKCLIYRQSSHTEVLKMAYVFSSNVTLNTLKGIYGDKTRLGYYNSALIQVADILLPQLIDGPMPTVTPIGADQAPHARLTRDIARKQVFQETYKFKLPSFTYHYLIKGIDGSDKMSKKNPMSVFTLGEDLKKDIKPKIQNALTGGRDTAAEQREKGGNPDECRVFDLFRFMFEPDDEKLMDRKKRCLSGELLCGYCKKDLLQAIGDFQDKHNAKKTEMFPIAEKILASA